MKPYKASRAMKGSALILSVLLAGCASNPERPARVLIVPIPSGLVEPVPEPVLEGDTNADLLTWIDKLRAALGLANDRLRSIGKLGE